MHPPRSTRTSGSCIGSSSRVVLQRLYEAVRNSTMNTDNTDTDTGGILNFWAKEVAILTMTVELDAMPPGPRDQGIVHFELSPRSPVSFSSPVIHECSLSALATSSASCGFCLSLVNQAALHFLSVSVCPCLVWQNLAKRSWLPGCLCSCPCTQDWCHPGGPDKAFACPWLDTILGRKSYLYEIVEAATCSSWPKMIIRMVLPGSKASRQSCPMHIETRQSRQGDIGIDQRKWAPRSQTCPPSRISPGKNATDAGPVQRPLRVEKMALCRHAAASR